MPTLHSAMQRWPRRRRAAITSACAVLALTLTLAVIAAAGNEPGPERSPVGLGCGRLSVSAPTTVLTAYDRTRLELTAWPDTQPGVLRSNAGSYYFLAAGAVPGQFGRQHQTVTSGTLDDPVLHGIVARSSIEGLPAGFTYAGAGQVWRDPRTGTVLQVVHLERQTAPGRPLSFWTEIGLVRLDLPSFTATFLGTILRPAVTFEQADRLDATVDVGTPSLARRSRPRLPPRRAGTSRAGQSTVTRRGWAARVSSPATSHPAHR